MNAIDVNDGQDQLHIKLSVLKIEMVWLTEKLTNRSTRRDHLEQEKSKYSKKGSQKDTASPRIELGSPHRDSHSVHRRSYGGDGQSHRATRHI